MADLARTAVRASFAPDDVQAAGARRDRRLRRQRSRHLHEGVNRPRNLIRSGANTFVTGVTAPSRGIERACRACDLVCGDGYPERTPGRGWRSSTTTSSVVVGVAALLAALQRPGAGRGAGQQPPGAARRRRDPLRHLRPGAGRRRGRRLPGRRRRRPRSSSTAGTSTASWCRTRSRRGASGYLSKGDGGRGAGRAIERIHAGGGSSCRSGGGTGQPASPRATGPGKEHGPHRPRGGDHRPDHPGALQPGDRRAQLPEHQLGQDLHPHAPTARSASSAARRRCCGGSSTASSLTSCAASNGRA